MKKILLLLGVLCWAHTSFTQLLSWSPAFQTESSTSTFEITMTANYGNKGLYFYTPTTDVYVHIGVITNLSTSGGDWRYVRPGSFTAPVAALQATYTGSTGNDRWKFTIYGGLRSYFGITDPSEHIQKIAILFRNGNGSKVQRNADGSDMYIPINDGTLETRFTLPYFQPLYNPVPEPINASVGGSINLTAMASAASNMRILFDGSAIQTASSVTTISTTKTGLTAGTHTVTAEATSGITKTHTFSFFVPAANVVQALPAGVRNGINYEADQTAATLVLYAPGKSRATLIGDLPGSGWQEQLGYQMKKTPDGNYYWLRITGLTPGTEYSFQYLVDGNLRIGEAYAEKILDPWNDSYISSTTYPGLKAYPTGLTSGVVSILQTAAPGYTWQTTGYNRPDKRNLMIYELLLRDFIATHDWQTMSDTLNYLKKLGINTIELMPINEFEGNNSWGYNPDYYFAPDKYYGPKNDLKQFIDLAHSKGMAVVMDIALNHSFGLSPMVQLYWDAANNRPASNNPWYNPVAKHAFNVGYDFNHSTAATKYFFGRVVEHWLTEYKIDGFRFDLSKGFTQTQTCDGSGGNCDVAGWSNYDASRIAIWKGYYDTLQNKSNGSYAILEHFAANSEEQELSNYGLMLWGNIHSNFSEASMGWLSNSNFDGALHINRGWSNPYLVSYMESHDEERIMYNMLNYANQSNAAYNTRTLPVAAARMGMSASFLFTMPGPKMMWEFGELAYDYSINYCISTGTNGDCRVDPKPIKWDYLQNADRKKLHDVYAAILQLRSNPQFFDAFTTGSISRNFWDANGFKWMTLNSPTGKLVVVGNFNVTAQTSSVTFPAAGIWYNYLMPINGGAATFSATGAAQSITLQPGEYYVYLNQQVVLPVSIVRFSGKSIGNNNVLSWDVQNETNLQQYQVQRSRNGIDFENIGSINANGQRNYSFTDVAVANSAIYFYRLKSVNADGSYQYSSIVRLGAKAAQLTVTPMPNRFDKSIQLNIANPVADAAQVVLSNTTGSVLLRRKVSLAEGNNALQLNNLPAMAQGIYLLTVTTSTNQVSARLVKVAQ